LWDLCAALLLYYAVQRLLPAREARLALALAFLEFLAAMQHASSTNTVVAALVILAFVALEDQQQGVAALAIALGALMKIYPLARSASSCFIPGKVASPRPSPRS
jgi:Gpi18-like mannosyltransferase